MTEPRSHTIHEMEEVAFRAIRRAKNRAKKRRRRGDPPVPEENTTTPDARFVIARAAIAEAGFPDDWHSHAAALNVAKHPNDYDQNYFDQLP